MTVDGGAVRVRDDLPIGRRVAQWRARRRMTQQVFADRIGKSKSWVDKVERGARRLDRFSVIHQIAEVLRVDPAELVGAAGSTTPPPGVGSAVPGVEAVRAALACYDIFGVAAVADTGTAPPDVGATTRRVEHAWLAYRHAHYPQLLRMLPDLLTAARRLHAADPVGGGQPLVQVYRIASSVLVKLDETDLAWLAADRAMTVASTAGDPLLAATAAVPLGQTLRAVGQGRLAMSATIAAAHRLDPAGPAATTDPAESAGDWPPPRLSVYGTLLLQAALAAAECDDAAAVRELTGQAGDVADQIGDGHDHQRSGFGPTAVELARVVAAADLGEAEEAVRRHAALVRRPGWRGLPAEHRAAYLVDVARAALQSGDLVTAGRSLVDADRVASAEVRLRPSARTVVAEVARCAPPAAGVAGLAATLGLTR
ncbi:helix-turn-helix protein [Micromonospora sp. Llam0]|uniref:helix-turn-helix domain-containing protein n=1 Tax=Micromonospora sp. Llam0 TaxID=2485143 RepID=UPI000FAA5E61|nr:helix-turn-helix transcriptional regulator [Micromonospora sp. Llam0]ROO59178.1 helix-turn-helix protein [Micromonospora sp. Llam0]